MTQSEQNKLTGLAKYLKESPITAEESARLLDLARVARKEKALAIEANKHNVRTNYLDKEHHTQLARKFKVRMPNLNAEVSKKSIRKSLKKCKVENVKFCEHYTSIDYFVINNTQPVVPLSVSEYEAQGLILELIDV